MSIEVSSQLLMTKISESNIAKWSVIITTQAGQSLTLTSDVPVSQNEAITNALADLIMKVTNSIDERGV